MQKKGYLSCLTDDTQLYNKYVQKDLPEIPNYCYIHLKQNKYIQKVLCQFPNCGHSKHNRYIQKELSQLINCWHSNIQWIYTERVVSAP